MPTRLNPQECPPQMNICKITWPLTNITSYTIKVGNRKTYHLCPSWRNRNISQQRFLKGKTGNHGIDNRGSSTCITPHLNHQHSSRTHRIPISVQKWTNRNYPFYLFHQIYLNQTQHNKILNNSSVWQPRGNIEGHGQNEPILITVEPLWYHIYHWLKTSSITHTLLL